MVTLVEDARPSAEWISRALLASGYRADFTPGSLWEIERFFEQNSQDGMPRNLLAQDCGARLFALGAYVGEVIRRARGGEWQADDRDPLGEVNIALHLAPDDIIWPVQRAMRRLKNGPEDNIAHYGHVLGLDVGARPLG